MNREFIPYELALELKRVGYDEPCLAWYNPKGTLLSDLTIGHEETDFFYTQNDMDENQCIAPTYSQAFRWFRDNNNIHSYIDILKRYNGKSVYEFVIVSDDIEEEENNRRWKTYEEAEFECLKELIEIVNEKQ